MPLGMELAFGPGDFELDGDPAPPPQISAHVYCGQTAGWMKLVLGLEVGLVPGDIVLDGDPAYSPQSGTASNFRPMSVVAKRLDGSRCQLVQR